MSTPTPSDGEHDAWLVQALRHAPDADAQPPQDLSDTILRQARQACDSTTARPTRVPRPGIAATLWSWLARPQLTGALASVLVLVFAGVMWMHQPVEQVVHDSMSLRESAAPAQPRTHNRSAASAEARMEDRPAVPRAAAPAPVASDMAPTESLRLRSNAEGKLSMSSGKPAVPDRDPSAAAKAAKDERSFAQSAVAPPVVAPAPLQTPPPTPTTALAPAPVPASPLTPPPSQAPVLGSSVAPSPAPSPSPAPAVVAAAPSPDSFLERRAPIGAAAPIVVAPPPQAAPETAPSMAMKSAPKPPAPQVTADNAERQADQMHLAAPAATDGKAGRQAAAADRLEKNATLAAAPPSPAALARSAEPSPSMSETERRAELSAPRTAAAMAPPPVIARDARVTEQRARTGPSPMVAILGEIAQNPSRWTALRGAGATQPMSDALQRWLARVSTAAAAQWQPAAAAQGGALTEVTRLTLLRDGVPQLSVGWIGDVVRIAPLASEGPAQEAQLPAARARELQDAVPRIVP